MNLDLMEFILEVIYLRKYGAYVINLDEYADFVTRWIALMIMMLFIVIALELNIFLKKSDILFEIKTCKQNIFRIQGNNLVMCGYFCIGFINYMLAGKTLIDYNSFFYLMILKKMIKSF